ncbi:SAM-dependent methyltransferase [Saccharopolyspora oryzae]|uniref:SAM-dependent methyltransferase n=1 Tax=Saccharopolyspora oryzae TaxID=2997343 RepID=A0ABT4UWB2_9PSEU|nr:SAM-dependent methyltransferase [Saccharopolyspora oryzae]MDA3625995.1 SAM-dependent methyltransferase [Saccharopolyspora oryzae]
MTGDKGDPRLAAMADIHGAVDIESPNAARMYDYYLGGDANFAADREAAEKFLAIVPTGREWAAANRGFLGRAVRFMVEQGIDQFLDLGSGIPTVGNVHEIAHAANPAAKVAYVDREPVAVAHARALLGSTPQVTVTQADIRDPEAVLSAPGVAELLDFTKPVGLLAIAILHFVSDDDRPADIVSRYRAACAPGSYLALSHLSPVTFTDDQLSGGHAVYNRTSTPGTLRTPEQIAELLTGYELVDPGLVLLPEWRPDTPVAPDAAARTNSYAAVGILPG